MTLKEHLATHPMYAIISVAIAVAGTTYKTIDVLLVQPQEKLVSKLEREVSSLKGRELDSKCLTHLPQESSRAENLTLGSHSPIYSVGGGATNITNYNDKEQIK